MVDMQADFFHDYEKQVRAILNGGLDLGMGINKNMKFLVQASGQRMVLFTKLRKMGKK